MRPIASEIVIDAPPERVFAVVTDLDRYPEWNRFTPRISLATRELRVGAELDLDCRMSERELLRGEREVILAFEPERFAFCMGTSRTRGRPGIRSERWQVCEPLEGGRTRLRNWERFTGPIAPLVYVLYAGRLRRAFEGYCRDLKTYLETGAAPALEPTGSSAGGRLRRGVLAGLAGVAAAALAALLLLGRGAPDPSMVGLYREDGGSNTVELREDGTARWGAEETTWSVHGDSLWIGWNRQRFWRGPARGFVIDYGEPGLQQPYSRVLLRPGEKRLNLSDFVGPAGKGR